MSDAVQAFETIKATADKARCMGARRCPAMAPGDVARQGDVYIRCIAGVPDGAVRVAEPGSQVAPGNTPGSRHRIRELCDVTVYTLASPNALQGPVIDAPRGFVLDHGTGGEQDHATIEFGPGVYLVTFQRAYADELRRVQD